MFSSLVRLFECGASNKQPRFIPRLEALDGRVLPGGLSGGVLAPTSALIASQVVSNGNVSAMHIGEEIPQTKRAFQVVAVVNSDGVCAGDSAVNDGHTQVFGGRGGLGGDF